MLWIVGDQPERLSFDAHKGRDGADAEIAPHLQHGTCVAERIDHAAYVVHAYAIFRNQMAQRPLIDGRTRRAITLHIAKILLRRSDRCCFILDKNIDNAVGCLDADGTNIISRNDS